MSENSARHGAVIVVLIAGAVIFAASAGMADDLTSLADDLEAVETAFAATMAARDHRGFKAFLADEVIFFNGDVELRGKKAVAAAWAPFFSGETAPFSWRPEVVSVLDSGNLGLTSGAVLDPEGNRVGTFNSVWRKTPEGGWEIVFDRGCR
jgi:ketosteroid isomerase-like protein